MIVYEGNGALTVDTFLLNLRKRAIRPKQPFIKTHPLPHAWEDKVEGKRIVCFYLGKDAVRETLAHDAPYLTSRLSFLRKCFSHVQDVLLWWLDDGTFRKLADEYEAELAQGRKLYIYDGNHTQVTTFEITGDEVAFERARLKRIVEAYENEVQAFEQGCTVIYDNSGNNERALVWSDACYTDDLMYIEAFENAGKLAEGMDFIHVCDVRSAMQLPDFLKIVTHKGNEKGCSFCEQARSEGKRIVLAYVSSADILHQGIGFFEIWQSFMTACSMQGVAVWWVCDDNISELLEAMGLVAQKRYFQLREQAEQNQDFFLDESGCLENAIKHCDAYYGSYADVVVHDVSHGMPVVWYDYGRGFPHECSVGNSRGMLMSFIHGCWIGDEFYFTHWQANGLFRVSHDSNQAEFVTRLPFKSKEKKFLSAKFFHVGGILYFVPTCASEILAWNMRTEEWHAYELDPQYAQSPYVWFAGAFLVADSLWLKPVNYTAMVRFDLSTHEIFYYSGWGGQVWDMEQDSTGQYWGEAALVGEDIWMVARQSGYIMKFSTVSQTSEMHEVPEAASGFRSLAHDGTDFWLYTFSDILLRWNPERGIVGCWKKPLGEGKGGAVICKAGKAWLFAHLEDAYVKIDAQSGVYSYCEHYLPEEQRSGLGFAQLAQDDGSIYIYPNVGELIVRFDPNTETVEIRSLRMTETNEVQYALANFQSIKEPVGENLFYDIYELVLYLRLGCRSSEMSGRESNKSVGRAVYEKVVCLCK